MHKANLDAIFKSISMWVVLRAIKSDRHTIGRNNV